MDIEKTMEFILSVQARLEASAQKHDERIAKHDEQIGELKSSIATLTDLVGRLAHAEIRLVERLDAVTAAMTAGFQELRELHADTEAKLNALIAADERNRVSDQQLRELHADTEAKLNAFIAADERNRAGIQELRELHANTEAKLSALIDTVDKFVRRDGHKE